MDSPQSVASPLKSSSIFPDSERRNALPVVENRNFLKENDFQMKGTATSDSEESLGALEVHINQARDIHNICIYQKQDVYAKLCLTSDPERCLSTRIINGGGRNPIFNENLSLTVRTLDSSLKCEIWMLSRVRNYLEDQLLGFTLVPISEILLHNRKLEKEFSLSSTDLFHSPAGFVHLSVSYIGSEPEVFPVPAPPASVEIETESDGQCALHRIEFPDPKVVSENNQMVEEYFAMPCDIVSSQSSENLVNARFDDYISSNVEVQPGENISKSPSSLSKDGVSSVPVSSESSETPKHSTSHIEEHTSPPNGAPKSSTNGMDSKSNNDDDTFAKSLVTVSIESENKVVQQDIVDMYMKSMQQFTDSLAKMKLPVDFESGPTSSENSTSSDQKTPASKNSGSRVFYGSRAFF